LACHTSCPSFSSRVVQTHINNIKEPAGKLRKDGESRQNLTIHLVMKLALLGIQADNLHLSRGNLRGEVSRHSLGLEL
jgi:hypothetical protein